MLRKVGAVLSGVVVGGLAVWVVETLGHAVVPPPLELQRALAEAGSDPDALRAAVAGIELPAGPLLAVAIAWLVGAFVAAWVSGRLANSGASAFVAGTVLMALAVLNLLLLPHPVWFWVVGLAAYPLGTWLGARLATGRPTPVPAA